MFQNLKQIMAPTNKDLRGRLIYTLVVLMIFVVGTNVRVPGTEDFAGSLGFLELINVMGGGALKKFSIFALGVMPYITASIIMQLLQMEIIPYFSELNKQGHTGRQKLNKITRYMGIVIAFIEGFFFAFGFLGADKTTFDYLYVATVLAAGTAFLLWLGDQVTQKGIGNGTSLIIMAGIIATLPAMFIQAFRELVLLERFAMPVGIALFIGLVIIYLLIVVGVIWVQEAERRIPIQYTNKSTTGLGNNHSFMPIKINAAGVVPVIFASSLMAIPATIAQFVKNTQYVDFVNKYLDYTKPLGFFLFVVFIYFFSYFYTFIQIKPEELAKNLNENGGFIPGIRPGKDTEKYVIRILSRLTLVGGLFIVIIAGLPIVFNNFSGLSANITIGGTGLLIVVGVALETYKQLEGSLVSRNYKKGYSRR